MKGISAVSANDIWSVGDYNPNIPPTVTGRRTLIEHWDAASWRLVASPNPVYPGLDFAARQAVDMIASAEVWASATRNISARSA